MGRGDPRRFFHSDNMRLKDQRHFLRNLVDFTKRSKALEADLKQPAVISHRAMVRQMTVVRHTRRTELFLASLLGSRPDLLFRGIDAEILKLLARFQRRCKPSGFQPPTGPCFGGV